jgi:glycosyltransferase involved in cell wall biosynthesis
MLDSDPEDHGSSPQPLPSGGRALLTVIIPTIRLDAWLDEAVYSVLESDEGNITLIVVFDGIIVGSMPRWASLSNVKVILHEHRVGLPAGLNSALEQTTTELVARLDADDKMSVTRLRLQADYLQTHPDALAVGSRVMQINEEGLHLGELALPLGPDIRSDLIHGNSVAHPAVMFRLEAVLRAGAYDESMVMMEDYDLWLRLALLGPIANLDEICTFYRVHGDQMSGNAKATGHYIRKVVKGQRQLSKALHLNPIRSALAMGSWRIGQFVRGVKTLIHNRTLRRQGKTAQQSKLL